MRPRIKARITLLASVGALAPLLCSGCASIAASAATGLADNLSTAILNQDDPETVRDGAPAYLLLMDSLVESAPGNHEMLQSAANLYAAYGAVFVEEGDRAKRLTRRGFAYGKRAMCIKHEPACTWDDLDFDEFAQALNVLDKGDVAALYSYTVSWLAFSRVHRDDFKVLADLPKVEAALDRLYALDPVYEGGSVHLYLGILHTLRPPALGGRPEEGREHFERAIELSDGKNLGAKVEYARSYARLLYDRDLHDRLLTEVMEAEAAAPGLTLFNTLAKREAEALLAGADDYF